MILGVQSVGEGMPTLCTLLRYYLARKATLSHSIFYKNVDSGQSDIGIHVVLRGGPLFLHLGGVSKVYYLDTIGP